MAHSLANNRPFTDGNKRTAYAAGARFLFLNGYTVRAAQRNVVKFLLDVEAKRLSLESIAAWFRRHAKRSA